MADNKKVLVIGGGFSGLLGKEAPVIADDHAPPFLAIAGDLIGQRLTQAAYVMQRETLADDGPPAPGAERHLILLFLAAGTEDPLLENELGVGQVLGSVDALDLILVVQLIAIHA